MEIGEKGSSTKIYSMVETASAISSQAIAGDLSSILGVNFLAVLFFATSLFVPILQLAGLLFLWTADLTLLQQKKVYVVNEILAAWQYMEVYLIAIVIALMQMGQVSGFMVGDACDGITVSFPHCGRWPNGMELLSNHIPTYSPYVSVSLKTTAGARNPRVHRLL